MFNQCQKQNSTCYNLHCSVIVLILTSHKYNKITTTLVSYTSDMKELK